MTFGYKNTEAALHAYTAVLKGLKLGQGFFVQLNLLYTKLIVELFKCLRETNSLHRMDEFKSDFQMFTDDMIRKYSTTSPYGYSPRSPYEKKMGIKPSSPKSQVYARDEQNKTEHEMRP
jgi:hypothetical protein